MTTRRALTDGNDLLQLRLPVISTFVLPKVHSPEDLHYVSRKILEHRGNIQSANNSSPNRPINLVASIESARSLINIGGIASWQSQHGPVYGGKLSALLVCRAVSWFTHYQPTDAQNSLLLKIVCSLHLWLERESDAVLDCADTSIIRTSSRRELLYTRSQVSITARAFKLEAIDMVCSASLPTRYNFMFGSLGLYQLPRS